VKSRYELHVERWKNGCGCELCPQANKIVFARGTLPCHVLFVGEGPGDSENLGGRPFIGPAGYKLEEIVAAAWAEAGKGPELTRAYYNLIGCLPREEDGSKSHGGLDHEWVIKCQPRLKEFLGIANPKLVVTLGKEPKQYFEEHYKHAVKLPPGVEKVALVHPASILRANVIQQGILIQQAVVTLANALEELKC